MAVLQAEIADAGDASGREEPLQVRWALLDKSLSLLLIAWSLYLVSWLVG
jgi:hypothetical protein